MAGGHGGGHGGHGGGHGGHGEMSRREFLEGLFPIGKILRGVFKSEDFFKFSRDLGMIFFNFVSGPVRRGGGGGGGHGGGHGGHGGGHGGHGGGH